MAWAILNAIGVRWGCDTYPSKAAAQSELKAFWKGQGADLRNYEFIEVADDIVQGIAPVKRRALPLLYVAPLLIGSLVVCWPVHLVHVRCLVPDLDEPSLFVWKSLKESLPDMDCHPVKYRRVFGVEYRDEPYRSD